MALCQSKGVKKIWYFSTNNGKSFKKKSQFLRKKKHFVRKLDYDHFILWKYLQLLKIPWGGGKQGP